MDTPRQLNKNEKHGFDNFNILKEVRNIIAHSAYLPEVDGITFTYSNSNNENIKPHKDFSFKQFDDFNSMATKLSGVFGEIHNSCKELKDETGDLRNSILECTDNNEDNIILFPKSPRDN